MSQTAVKPAGPQSPFFHPSKPKLVTVTQSVTTPRGTHTHILSQTQLLQRTLGDTATSPQYKPPSFDVLEAKSSLIGAYANLVNAIVGAGIVGIPYALNQTGLLTGILLILLVAALTDKSLRILIDTGKLLRVHSYELLMEALFGKAGFVFISLSMFVMSYGGMICYLLIIKDTIPTLLHMGSHTTTSTTTSSSSSSITTNASSALLEADALEWEKRMVLIACSLTIILPLSLQRDMAHLSKTSSLSVLFDILLVGIVLFFSPVRESIEANGGIQHVLRESTIHPQTLFTGLGVLSFAFVCQDSSFLIAGSLHQPTQARWKTVTRWAMTTCTLLAIVMGVSGYLAFQSSTDGNILNNFSSTSYLTLSPMSYASTTLSSTSTSPMDTTTTTTTTTTAKTRVSSNLSHIVTTTKIISTPKASSTHKSSSSTSSPTPPTLLPSQQWAANIARFLLGTTMFFVYPLASFVCRHVLIVLFFQGPIAREGNDHTALKRADRRFALTVFLYLTALLPALFCDSVGTILAITGAIGGSCLSYVGPGVAFLGAHGQVFLDMVRQRWIKHENPKQDLEYGGYQDKYCKLWMFPTAKDNSSPNRMIPGEHTPLLFSECSQEHSMSGHPNKTVPWSSRGLEHDSEESIRPWDIFIWYACCMPLWCTIASIGSRKSQAFIQQQKEHNQGKVVKSGTTANKTIHNLQAKPTLESPSLIPSLQMNHLGPLSSKDVLDDRLSSTRLLKHTYSDPVLDTHRRNHAVNVTLTVGDQVLLVPYPSLTTVRAYVDVSYGSEDHSNNKDRRTPSLISNKKCSTNASSLISKYQQSPSISTQEKEDDFELPGPVLGSHVNIQHNVVIQEGVMTTKSDDETEDDSDIDSNKGNPTWSDFVLSISYIILGVVATTAGLLSILSG